MVPTIRDPIAHGFQIATYLGRSTQITSNVVYMYGLPVCQKSFSHSGSAETNFQWKCIVCSGDFKWLYHQTFKGQFWGNYIEGTLGHWGWNHLLEVAFGCQDQIRIWRSLLNHVFRCQSMKLGSPECIFASMGLAFSTMATGAHWFWPIGGHTYLVLVDAYSKWPEAIYMPSSTATKTIEALRHMFVSYGLALRLVSTVALLVTSWDTCATVCIVHWLRFASCTTHVFVVCTAHFLRIALLTIWVYTVHFLRFAPRTTWNLRHAIALLWDIWLFGYVTFLKIKSQSMLTNPLFLIQRLRGTGLL